MIYLKYDNYIFDLDGTLLDTLADLREADNYALEKHGLPVLSLVKVREYIGSGIRNLMLKSVYGPGFVSKFGDVKDFSGSVITGDGCHAYAEAGGRIYSFPVDADEFEELLEEFRGYYNEHVNVHTVPYEGMTGLLRELHAAGRGIGVVSNKYDSAVKELCGAHFGETVHIAIGQRKGIAKKPDPASVFEMMELMGAKKENTVYIGDSEVDIRTAENAGLDCVICSWGFRDRSVLEKAGAEVIADNIDELRGILQL